jgi:hypothetical protein
MAFNQGDEIDLINHESYESYGLNTVKEATLLNPREMLLVLEENIPPGLELGDVIENVTWTPDVEIRGCSVSRIPTRGFLISTRQKVVIEENKFLATHMSAILLAIDANNWFESGYVHDMTIRNNKFINCAEPVILIEPGNSVENNSVYKNIRIEKNEFMLLNELMVKAKSTENLIIKENHIVSEKKLNDEMTIKTSDCIEVELEQNVYISKQRSK